MDPSSPTKRRALAPLDANVNAMSPTKMHKHSKVPGSPRKSPIKTPLGLKRPLASVIFDENAVAKKKQCQEPAAAASSVSASAIANASALVPPHVSAVTPTPATPAAASEDTIASTSTHTSASTPTPAAPAQTEMGMDPDTKEVSGALLMERFRYGLGDRNLMRVSPWQDQGEQQDQLVEQKLHDEPREQRQLEKVQPREEQQMLRNRSASPDTSSVFDNSAMDTSQENTTMLTEPDAEQTARAQPPARPRRLLTREEARQKARILRLKLGLANYKLQTGQENVPLDRLEVKPRPGQQLETPREGALPRVTVQPPSSRDGPPEKDTEETSTKQRENEPEPVADVKNTTEPAIAENTAEPCLVTAETGDTEDEDEDEDGPTSVVCGGVASSLLSLARASSSFSSS
ncbi:hypothetical protein CGRA01v4_08038 [Colletotrichum graminicola]|uniref:Cyclin-dependent kinase n=1 Tax=Colletotrichum graminicola (strain M1.001 / M2 / FGSC 10212) TaxID=645133 RepID=E3Q812_COLGM|nr:uncharacterized protein GLRG_02195 [Colletotrichum graminicola M1.001]EFQ27024.1 hypothetical protein GLRG_02195 [Colletotrichum graminicola M1.001]WDK16755.1 hypothetical protein CGRA01v4_08038 [Colletotrichum graminicola]